ncbi:hypothetical protein G3I32_36200 [Streptomyces coelicoflavus]|uniref:Uncharacterized protein n=1 Tax=Streptomyces coelicoflavus TaxID=285562 RepID=A0A7K3PYH6_9ACTN|nr:hypothetical protein [Streptomyces coelicoflavus]NEB14209.1 hypothetical protein [Streptomyces coelicoflavus]
MSASYRRARLSPAALARLDQTAAAARQFGRPAIRVTRVPSGTACCWCDCPDDAAVLGRHAAAACSKCPADASVAVTLRAAASPALVAYTLCARHTRPWWHLQAAAFGFPTDQPPPGLIPTA